MRSPISQAEPKLAEKASNQKRCLTAQVADQHYDFGTMQRGTSKEHEFTIRNVSGAPLKLRPARQLANVRFPR